MEPGQDTGKKSTETCFATMSDEEIRAYEVDVMRRIADLALIPPKLNTDPVPRYDYDQLDYGMNESIERTRAGRLWAAWVAGEDGPKAFMVAATSDDNGETWSKPRLVIDSHSGRIPIPRSVIIGNFWTDPMGRLWFFFDQSMNHFDGRGGIWASVCENPDDENPGWSAPRRIWHGWMLNKPLILSTGEWMIPASLAEHNRGRGPFEDVFPELDPWRGVNVLVSDDAGRTWQRRASVKFPHPDWHEAMLLEIREKKLWMLARTRKGIMQSFSSDSGQSWSEPALPPGMNHISSRFHARRLASGRILMVKHGETMNELTQERHKLKAFLSEDDGASWIGGLMLDERSTVSYPDGCQAPDGTIYVSYDRNRDTDGEILLARFTEEDVMAGEPVSIGSRLKMLISRPLKKEVL